MKKYTFLFFLGLVASLFTACSDDDNLTDSITPAPESENFFANGMTFASQPGVRSITFTAGRAWQAALDEPGANNWCIVTPTRGEAGTVTVSITVNENESDDTRNVHLNLIAGSAQKSFTISQTPKPIVIPEGLSYSLEEPDADRPLTIYYRAASSSLLYNYQGTVYAHTGIICEGSWSYVQSEWNENTDKCKMSKLDNNVWTLTLSPSIRQWYSSEKTPVKKLGFVLRNEDGSLQTEDLFIPVTDNTYQEFVPASIKKGTLPENVAEGINIIDNSTVTLVLYDKDTDGNHKDFAHVVGDFNHWQLSNEDNCQMYRDDASGCWWITLRNLDANKEYAFQYYVGTRNGETIRLGDAYCEKILDPDNDSYISSSTYPDNKSYPEGGKGIVSVFKIQQDNYRWSVSDFKVPNPEQLVIYEMLLRDFTASNDLNGAMQKLDYLKSLGVNAIELMPVQEFDGNDSWGYNPCFFFALDKAYGTKKMYKDFIDACHKAGMAVIFDVVYNHATGSMPFAKLYWNSANNKTAPNNPYFNVDAPHPYSVFHDFNHESPLVRKFVKRNLQFLLNEYHIDGFRFDLTKGFTQAASTESSASNYDKSRIEILKDYHAAIKEVKPEAYVILEHFCDSKEEKELAEDGMHLWRNMNNAYCQTAMGWNDDSAFDGLYESIPAWIGFMESHDEERAAYKQTQWGDEALKTDLTTRMRQLEVNASFFFTVPGPKMIWQFGEMGYDVSIEENGRTGKKPLHWEYLENKDRKALHDSYSRLIKLRNDNPELFTSTSQFSWEVGTSNWGQGRFITLSSTTKHMLVAGNFSKIDGAYTVTFPVTGKWYDYLTGDEVEVKDATQKMEIPAHSYRILTTFPCLN